MTQESVLEKGGDSMDYGKLKTYYESIDGVTVPFVYPQYWDKDKEEWVVVDKDNRLPVDARLTGSNVKDEDALPVKSRKVETYSSDRESFSIEVSPGSTYYASITFENGYITGSTGGDMRGYSKIAVGVQRQGGEHEYTLEVRSKAFGTNLSINQIEKRDGPDIVKLIEMELNYHSTSIRIINNSEEVQNYQLAVSAFPI